MRITKINGLILVSTLLVVTGCEKIEQGVLRVMLEPDAPDPAKGVQVVSDIVYSQAPQGDLLLDLYLPAAESMESIAEPLPVVLFFFGGAFEMGNKAQLELYDVHTLPLDGFAVVSIDYRLSDQAIFPAQLDDAQNALRWIHAHAGQYNLDANNIGVLGMSAGGMLAALVGTQSLDQAMGVQAVVDYYGPTDFLQGDEHALEGADSNWAAADSWPSRYLGSAIGAVPDRVAATNPITYVSADDPPFLIVHGDQDEIVPPHQSKILYDALQQAGVEVELYVVKDGGHARGGEFGSPELHRRTVAFLQQHLQ
jgi:acetyl esterase/lipase